MIKSLCLIFVCLSLGEVLSWFSPWPIPAAVIGFLILFFAICWSGQVQETLGSLADRMIQAFGLFFVPAGVGVIAYKQNIQSDYLAIAVTLFAGTLVTIAVTALTASIVISLSKKERGVSSWQPRRLPHT